MLEVSLEAPSILTEDGAFSVVIESRGQQPIEFEHSRRGVSLHLNEKQIRTIAQMLLRLADHAPALQRLYAEMEESASPGKGVA